MGGDFLGPFGVFEFVVVLLSSDGVVEHSIGFIKSDCSFFVIDLVCILLIFIGVHLLNPCPESLGNRLLGMIWLDG